MFLSPPTPTIALDAFTLDTAPITPAMIPQLHALSVGVGWPHRPEDWELVIELGEGLAALDEIGRIVGSVMWTGMGADFVHFGMAITIPRLQELGAGRWLMAHALSATAGRVKRLNATRAAFRLFRGMGFEPLSPSHQLNGIVTAPPPVPAGQAGETRAMRPEDGGAIRALDAEAFGAPRPAVIDRLAALSDVVVIERNGRVCGYAMCRRFGRGHVIGPVVAPDDAAAVALVAPHLTRHAGRFVRLDTRFEHGAFRDCLFACGLPHFDTVTWMGRDGRAEPTGGARSYALASQALG